MIKMINSGNKSLVVIIDGKPYNVDTSHPNYAVLFKAFHTNNEQLFLDNYDVVAKLKEEIKTITVDGLVVENERILFRGEVLNDNLVETILTLKRSGQNFEPLLNLLENRLKNPRYQARLQVWDFLRFKEMPITEDGCFIAYKTVRSDYWSKTAGKMKLIKGKVNEEGRIYNGVGEEIECEPWEVDDNRDNECSAGLHIGGHSYVFNSIIHSCGDKVVLCKVNPKDVVAVPKDYNATKMRVCAYTVISEYEEKLNQTVFGVEDTYSPPTGYSNNEIESYAKEYEEEDEDELFDACPDCECEDCECEEDESMPYPWYRLDDGDIVRVQWFDKDEFTAVVQSVRDEYVTLRLEDTDEVDVYWFDAQKTAKLISINGKKV